MLKIEHCPLTRAPGTYTFAEFISRSKYIRLYRSRVDTVTKYIQQMNIIFLSLYSHISPGIVLL